MKVRRLSSMGDHAPATFLSDRFSNSEPLFLPIPGNKADRKQPLEIMRIDRFRNLCHNVDLFHIEQCASTMDMAWTLFDRHEFPEWSSVLADIQTTGRGQFRRSWVSEAGNLFVSVRLGNLSKHPAAPSFVPALAVSLALKSLGLVSEFKWPNDILVGRKKIGGILVENRSGVMIAGIGINLTCSPPTEAMRDSQCFPPGHLTDFGLVTAPFELWALIHETLMQVAQNHSRSCDGPDLVGQLESIMAFKDEPVVFTSLDGRDFSAVLSGLTAEGGIRLKTADGEITFLTGSFFPVVH